MIWLSYEGAYNEPPLACDRCGKGIRRWERQYDAVSPFRPPVGPFRTLVDVDVSAIDSDACSACGEKIIAACDAHRGAGAAEPP